MSIRIGSYNPGTSSSLRTSSREREEEKKSFEKLSSGKQINRAADDAAGLAIANRMGEVLKGLEQGMDNVTDGMSMLETADSGLDATSEHLLRMRELAQGAANEVLSDDQRQAMEAEFSSLYSEVDRIAESLDFNGQKLLDGSSGEVAVSTGDAGAISLDFSRDMSADSLGLSGASLAGEDGENALAALDSVESALRSVAERRADYGASQNRLEGAHANLAVAAENTYAAQSRIMDTDYAVEMAEKTRHQLLAQASDAVLVQGRLMPSSVMNLLE